MALMNNASIDDSQSISVLASCSNNYDTSQIDKHSSLNDYIITITYESFASVIKQMDHTKGDFNPGNTFLSNAASTSGLFKNDSSSKFKSSICRKFTTIQQVVQAR